LERFVSHSDDVIGLKHLFRLISVENGEHCDFTVLRNMLIRWDELVVNKHCVLRGLYGFNLVNTIVQKETRQNENSHLEIKRSCNCEHGNRLQAFVSQTSWGVSYFDLISGITRACTNTYMCTHTHIPGWWLWYTGMCVRVCLCTCRVWTGCWEDSSLLWAPAVKMTADMMMDGDDGRFWPLCGQYEHLFRLVQQKFIIIHLICYI